uniref:RNase H type-1 domain-containing protein n=1 Tax=Anopheles christyi TaxID=43041 RepID=A0A182K8L6_9DIPT
MVLYPYRDVWLNNAVTEYEMHGSADASNVAYGVCIYIRCLFTDGPAKLNLLTSKSKLAPLRDVSIPRKELCAALLLARLIDKVISAIDISSREIILWCDSMIVKKTLKPTRVLRTKSSCYYSREY